MRADEVVALESQRVVQVYRRTPIVLDSGRGPYLYDVDGREYLDFISGIGVASLGHANPGLAAAIADQASALVHCSNLFYHPLQGQLADRLARLSGLDRAFFCNSGTEAVEACIKFARRYWHTRGAAERTDIVALEHAFHGRTLGSLSLTWDEHYRTPFAPLVPGVSFVKANDSDALRTVASDRLAAIIVEPIQGEGGVRPLTPAFARAVADLCRQTGALLIADEVQSGLGRTGHAFYSQALGLEPHLMALGKALGAGVPIGAALLREDVASAVSFGDHGSTYGGNLLACRAALFFLEELVEKNLLDSVRRVGAHLEAGLRRLAGAHASITDVRGVGLMWGLEMSAEATPIVDAARQRGLLVNRTAGTVVRLLPPLTITEAEVDRALAMLDGVLADVASGVSA